jgi:nitroreductase
MIYFEEPVTELVSRRCSWRSYVNEPLGEGVRDQIRKFISNLDSAPFHTSMRFSLIDTKMPHNSRVKGTYGVIKGARHFIVGTLKKADMAFEDFGYTMEAIILFITGLGLGTCWMGGTFSRSYFAQEMNLGPDEIIPAITPVGYSTKHRSVLDSLFYLGAGSKNRRPFEDLFYHQDFSTPLSRQSAGEYAMPLEMVRLAPSASNKQPWRIVKKDNHLHFYLQRSRGYNALFKEADLQRVDMGIAMFHFHSCVAQAGLAGEWRIADPGIIPLPQRIQYIASWIPQT